MDVEPPHEEPGRPVGQERDSWQPAQPAFGFDDVPPTGGDDDPEQGPLGAGRVGAGLSGALEDGAAQVPAEGRDTLPQPDIQETAGLADSIGVGEEGT